MTGTGISSASSTCQDIIETDFIPLNVTWKLQAARGGIYPQQAECISCNRDRWDFEGVINLDNVKEMLFRPELFDELKISGIMNTDLLILDVHTDIETAVEQIEQTAQWNIPVTENGKYVGFVSRANILSYYRKILKKSATLF